MLFLLLLKASRAKCPKGAKRKICSRKWSR